MMNTLVITEARGALALAGTGQGIVMVVAVLAVLAVIIAVLSRITNRATSQPQAATPAPCCACRSGSRTGPQASGQTHPRDTIQRGMRPGGCG